MDSYRMPLPAPVRFVRPACGVYVRPRNACMHASAPAFVACSYVVDQGVRTCCCTGKNLCWKKKQVILVVVPVPRLQGQFAHLHKFLCSRHGISWLVLQCSEKLTTPSVSFKFHPKSVFVREIWFSRDTY